jgi:hypothetical protein
MEKDLMVDAMNLAAFANLKPEDAENFRNAVAPGFVPEIWWRTPNIFGIVPDAPAFSAVIWKLEQQRLKDAWRDHFSPEVCLGLIVSANRASEFEYSVHQQTERKALDQDKEAYASCVASQTPPKPRLWPYQHAVMLLAMQPWRARICEICGKYFVKEEPRERYCSTACSKVALRDSKSKSWQLHGEKWRPRKSSK